MESPDFVFEEKRLFDRMNDFKNKPASHSRKSVLSQREEVVLNRPKDKKYFFIFLSNVCSPVNKQREEMMEMESISYSSSFRVLSRVLSYSVKGIKRLKQRKPKMEEICEYRSQ
jgi:hypothetical protein